MGYMLIGKIDGRGIRIELTPGAHTLGRSSKDASVTVPRDTVSRCHARVEIHDGEIQIEDLDSHNGTFVNGRRVKRASIHAGDSIRLGDVDFELQSSSVAATSGETPRITPSVSQTQPRSVPTFRSDAQVNKASLTWSQTPSNPSSLAQSTLGGRPRPSPQSELLAALVDLGSFLVRDEPGRDIAAACLEHVAQLFPFRLACILEINQTSGEAEVQAHYPPEREPDLEVSRTMVDQVVRERRTLLLGDVEGKADIYITAWKKGIRSAIVTPIMQDDQVLGVLYVDHEDEHRTFQTRDQEQLQFLANLVAAKIASTRTRNEIEWAAFIQNRLLPGTVLQPPGYAAAVRLVPSEQVGGDLYDSMELGDGRVLYALGDVVGHGVGAALMMSNALATLRALAQVNESPLELARQMHELLISQLAPHGFVTLFLGILDPRTHQMEYVTAGHPPPLLQRPGGESEFLASTGMPIGMPIPVSLRSERITLSSGSLLAIWSDGIPEAIRIGARPLQDYTQERLVTRLQEWNAEPLESILEKIFRDSDAFVGGPRAQDDRTMVLLRRTS